MKKRSPCAEPAARARWWRTFPVVCTLLVAHPAQASGDAGANRLFVEAAKLIQAAEVEAVATRKLELLKDAKRKLETIVDRHPSSRLAVELVSGQNIGTVSLPGLADAIEDAAVLACPQAPNPACLLSLAVATAGKIEGDTTRDFAFAMIGYAQARVGFIEKAFAIIEKVDSAYRYWALIAIAEAHVENSDIRKAWEILAIALESAGMIEIAIDRSRALAAVAGAQAKAEFIKEAYTTAEKIEDAGSRTQTLIAIAEAYVENGDVTKAREILAIALEATEESSNRYFGSWTLADIAEAQAKTGNIEDAFATANSIRDAYSRVTAFARIAVAAADAN